MSDDDELGVWYVAGIVLVVLLGIVVMAPRAFAPRGKLWPS